MDGHLDVLDAAFAGTAVGHGDLAVAGGDVDALDHDLVGLGVDVDDAALLALVLAADHDDGVVLLDAVHG